MADFFMLSNLNIIVYFCRKLVYDENLIQLAETIHSS